MEGRGFRNRAGEHTPEVNARTPSKRMYMDLLPWSAPKPRVGLDPFQRLVVTLRHAFLLVMIEKPGTDETCSYFGQP